jgi:prevent-host-death family protein
MITYTVSTFRARIKEALELVQGDDDVVFVKQRGQPLKAIITADFYNSINESKEEFSLDL